MKKLSNVALIQQEKLNFQNTFQQLTQDLTNLQHKLHQYYLQALQALQLGNYVLNTSIIKELKMYLWQMQKITELSGGGETLFLLEINSEKQEVVNQLSIDKIIELHRQKTQISINKSTITEENITKLKHKCPSLNSLTIKSQTSTIEQILADPDINILAQLGNLTKLSIKGSRITDKGISGIMQKLINLKEIDLSQCRMISNDGLKCLSGYRFVCIKVNGCEGISERGILSLIATSYNLNYLQIAKITSLNYSNLIEQICLIYHNNSINFKWLQLHTNIGSMLFINKLSYLTHFAISDFITDREVQILLGEQPQIDGLFFNSCEQLHSDTIHYIISKCKRLRHLGLTRFINLTDALLGDIVSHITTLQYLDIGECFQITDKSIYQIANQLRKLTSLNLNKCQNITDESIAYLIQKMPTLININISYCKKLTDESLFYIGNHLPELKSLNIQKCQQITNIGLSFLSEKLNYLLQLTINFCEQINDESMMLVATRFRRLRKLEMEWCQISQKCLSLITQNMHELTTINLNYCSSVLDDAIFKLGRHSPKLHTIKLQSCDKLSSKAFAYLFQNLKSMRNVYLKECVGVNDAVVEKLSSNSRGQIMSLDLSWCSNITDKGILSISQFQHQILHLNLNGCKLISDSGVKWICSTMTSIEYLNLTLCDKITDKSIIQVGKELLNLRILCLCDIKNLTDNSISCLASLTNLEELHLSGCINITSSSLIALLHNLEKLQSLNISQCSNIFTESLLLLIERMNNLKKFYLASLQVEDNMLQMIGEYMTHLRFINLEYCRKITDKGVLRLMQKVVSLVRIDIQNTGISQYTKQMIFQQLSFRQNNFIGFNNKI